MRTRKDLLQSQWWHRQLLEQCKVLQQQIRAEKEAEMLQCKNNLAQLQESLEQAQSDIHQWVRSCGGTRGLSRPGRVRSGTSCSPGACGRAQQQSLSWEEMPDLSLQGLQQEE